MLMSDVDCTGLETGLHLCSSARIGNHTCERNAKSAGVICSRDFGKLKHVIV